MMRYVITDASQKFVPLEKEITYISDYIELQKLRIDKGIKLSFEVTGKTIGKEIAPLILISFIENAFKYGITNGPTEGFNNKIKVMKRTAYGINNFERFRTRILHCTN